MKPSRLAAAAAASGALVLAMPVSALAAPSDEFKLNVTSAKLAVAGLPPFAIGSSQLASTPISITGTASGTGALSAPQSGIVFPSLSVPVPQELITQLIGQAAGSVPSNLTPLLGLVRNISINAGIKAQGAASGSVARNTGAISLNVPLSVEVGITAVALGLPIPLVTCKLQGLNFPFRTDRSSLTAGSALDGSPYDPVSKTAVLSGEANVTSPTCSGVIVSALKDQIDINQLAAGLVGRVGLQLDSAVTLPPAAEVTLPGVSRLKISSRGEVQQRVTCSTARACSGYLYIKLEDGSLLATRSYNLKAGRSTTLKAKLSSKLRPRMKTTPVMIGTLRATVTAGPEVTKGISLQRPLNWR